MLRYFNSIPAHYQDVGIECDTLLPFLKTNVYWKGIFFTPSNTSGSPSRLKLDNVDIVNAIEGIKALKRGPELENVSIKDSASGLVVESLQSPLIIVDSRIEACKFVGINITGNGGPVLIQNVTVLNTSLGDGLVIKQITNSMDFCSFNTEQIHLPLVLNASGKTYCSKVRKRNQQVEKKEPTVWKKFRVLLYQSMLLCQKPNYSN